MKRLQLFWVLCALGVVAVAGDMQKQDEFDIRYWTQIVSQSEVVADDSMVKLFIHAPECMPMETISMGFPRYVLGSRTKFVDERGRGWLIECVVDWEAKAQTKRNGSEVVKIYPQEFKSSLIFEPKDNAQQK